MVLVAKVTGWSQEALLAMPEPVLGAYLDVALRMHGVDVGDRVEGEAPPADGQVSLPAEVQAAVDRYLARG